MKNLILKYGLYSGAVSAALMGFTAWQIQKNGISDNGAIYGYSGMVLSMLFVYLGVRVFRDRERNGSISFGEAFKVGGLMALISCICYVGAWLLVYEFVMPDFMDQYIAYYLDKMKAKGIAESEIQKASAEMAHYQQLYKNPLYRAGLTFLEPLPVALVMSLISALLLKSRKMS